MTEVEQCHELLPHPGEVSCLYLDEEVVSHEVDDEPANDSLDCMACLETHRFKEA